MIFLRFFQIPHLNFQSLLILASISLRIKYYRKIQGNALYIQGCSYILLSDLFQPIPHFFIGNSLSILGYFSRLTGVYIRFLRNIIVGLAGSSRLHSRLGFLSCKTRPNKCKFRSVGI